ncbi:MAG: ABC transporter ATP-binding protein [Proteobacteria bacterium]|nr:ABC transporter ATP-binding protein [Pseudomonadota bacterium]
MTRAEGTAVRLIDCAKTFPDGTRALEPLSLEIEGGETIVFLGPSGCGKTTTLRIIAGLASPDTGGRVLFDDEDVTDQPIETRNVGMVFQSYALFPNMNVEQNVGYGLRVRKTPAAELTARVGEMLDMMDIRGLKDRKIEQLSGGQRQRVALARAIAVQPRILLLDEPLTSLDATLRERLRVEIDALLRGLGITAVYVTHDQAEAMALGDRIVVMSHGRVTQVGTPREIYYNPANRFVADFIGTMNRITGTAQDGVLTTRAGKIPWDGGGSGEIEVLFRPENASIADLDQAHLRGRISASFFLGDRTRLLVEGIGSEPLVIETSVRREYRVGEEIGLVIEPNSLLTLRD